VDRVPPDPIAQVTFLHSIGFPEATAWRALELSGGDLRGAVQLAHFGCPAPIPDSPPLPGPVPVNTATSEVSEALARLEMAITTWHTAPSPNHPAPPGIIDASTIYFRRQESEILFQVLELLWVGAAEDPDDRYRHRRRYFSGDLGLLIIDFHSALERFGAWQFPDPAMGRELDRDAVHYFREMDSHRELFDLHVHATQTALERMDELEEGHLMGEEFEEEVQRWLQRIEICQASRDAMEQLRQMQADEGPGTWMTAPEDPHFFDV
jgi:hypothetical protein